MRLVYINYLPCCYAIWSVSFYRGCKYVGCCCCIYTLNYFEFTFDFLSFFFLGMIYVWITIYQMHGAWWKYLNPFLKTSSIKCRDSPINGKIESMAGIYDSQIKSSVDVSKTSGYIVLFFKKKTILRASMHFTLCFFFFFLLKWFAFQTRKKVPCRKVKPLCLFNWTQGKDTNIKYRMQPNWLFDKAIWDSSHLL